MKKNTPTVRLAALLMLGLALPLAAQAPETTAPADLAAAVEPAAEESSEDPELAAFKAMIASLDWKTNGKGALGNRAEIEIPEGYQFTGSAGTVKLMQAYGNLTSGMELGYLSPEGMEWFAVFEFDDVGYVKDDEKDKLDADAILEQLREGQKAANEELASLGMSTLELTGWHTPPFYNPKTNNLEWAIRLRSSDGGETINYKTKLLGRRGVMDVVLVCDEVQMASVLPEYQKLLTGYSFKADEAYGAFKEGDKIAEYGLTGLILGGGLLMAAKSGLLTKLWKPIAAVIVVVGAFIKRLITGRSKETI